MLTDKQIFDAIRERRGAGLSQADVDAINAILYPDGVGGKAYDRAALEAELRRDEGSRLKAYKCTADKWTIGIGRNLEAVGTAPLNRSKQDIIEQGILPAEERALFNYDIDRTERDLDRKLPWWRKLDPVRQRVMLNMCFNLGITGLLGFVNTLGMIQRGDYDGAARNMLLSKWARQVGDRAKRLSTMMKTGKPV